MTDTPLQAALRYIEQGYGIMPAYSPRMLLGDDDWRTLIDSRKHLDRIAMRLMLKLCKMPLRVFFPPVWDAERAEKWFSRYPLANVMIVTGKTSGLAVLDVDFYRKAHQQMQALELPPTLKAVTGRGEHYYFRYPVGHAQSRRHYKGNFILADTASPVAPPSWHVNGRQYIWVNPGVEIAPLPDALRDSSKTLLAHPAFVHMHRFIKCSTFIYGMRPLLMLYFRLRFAR